MTDEERNIRLKQLVETGRKEGHVRCDEINELLPEDYAGGRELDDVLCALSCAGVKVFEEPNFDDAASLRAVDQGDNPAEVYTDDPVGVYLAEVATVPRLTRDAEIELTRKIRSGAEDAETAKVQLLESNLWLVAPIAKRFANGSVHLLDLIQEGNRSLLSAVKMFDCTRGYRFSTYATWWVMRALRRK
ncbi:MAG TPA: sigma-70 family RNA polymerase sigma factor [Bryobacteraceae bacterium]|nr:sigma-70 family RNA polymerase sigma factor [Bryobacteraceae bacterium]